MSTAAEPFRIPRNLAPRLLTIAGLVAIEFYFYSAIPHAADASDLTSQTETLAVIATVILGTLGCALTLDALGQDRKHPGQQLSRTLFYASLGIVLATQNIAVTAALLTSANDNEADATFAQLPASIAVQLGIITVITALGLLNDFRVKHPTAHATRTHTPA